jgi:hypothetical protein
LSYARTIILCPDAKICAGRPGDLHFKRRAGSEGQGMESGEW